MRLLRAHEFCSTHQQSRTWACVMVVSLSSVTVPGSAARFRTVADPDHRIRSSLFFSLAILNPLTSEDFTMRPTKIH